MWVWVDRLGALVLDASLSSLALWGVVTVGMLGCRQPARRLRLGRAAVVGSLALLPLIGLGLVPRYDVFSVGEGLGLVPHPLLPPRQRSTASPHVGILTAFEALAPLPGGAWPARVLTGLYLSGVGCSLAWLALGFAGLAWLARRSAEPSAGATALYGALPFPEGRRRPRLRVEARVRRPVLVGVWRPMILVPPEMDRPEARDPLRLSLLHELAHAEAGDPGFALVTGLAQAFWFFIPPLWWVASQLRLDQEFLADRRAADAYGPVRDYASSLLELASTRTPGTEPFARPDSGTGAEGSPLFQRVLMLLRCPFPIEPRPPVWWSWGLPAVVAAVTLAVSSLSLRPPAAQAVARGAANTFRMSRLELPPHEPGRSSLVELPVCLPDQFDLTVEVWADLPSLASTRLAGLPVRSPRLDDESSQDDPEAWHVVRVRRDDRSLGLWVDDDPVLLDLPSTPVTRWLSVEPALGRPVHLRNLVLNW